MNLKIQILFFYYERPILAKNALQSIKESTYNNYLIDFIDDSEDSKPGYELFKEYFYTDVRGHYIHTNDTLEKKKARGGSMFGYHATEVMKHSKADICIMLCDDDALYPDYLEKLNIYYNENTEINYSYGRLICYNPLIEKYDDIKYRTEYSQYLSWGHPLNPFCQVDSSQVSWRLPEANKENISFAYPRNRNLDADIYAKMFNAWGSCVCNDSIAQFKGQFSNQLGNRIEDYGQTE